MKLDWRDAVVAAGLMAICVGVGLIYLPAGVIAAGMAAVVYVVLMEIGNGRPE